MKLNLKDLQFDIKHATIEAAIRKGVLFWEVNLTAQEKDLNDEIWEPMIYNESLQIPVYHWMNLAGQAVSWNTALDPKTGQANGAFYVFEHRNISRSTLRFLNRQGQTFGLEWGGLCDVHWDDEYGENVPFHAEAMAVFTQVRVGGNASDTNETRRARLARCLDPDDFIQQPIQTNKDGVGLTYCVFEPKS